MLCVFGSSFFVLECLAQDQKMDMETSMEPVVQEVPIEEQASVATSEPVKSDEEAEPKTGYVTVDFKDADIRNVLRIISYKADINIVPSPEVTGFVTIRLKDVYWKDALDAILKTYGFGYDTQENIIMVAPLDRLTSLKQMEQDLAQVQPTITQVFKLKYLDAQDAKKAIEPQLSSRGKITILGMTGQAGWEFGGAELGKRKRTNEDTMSRSKVLIISDIPPAMDKIKKVIEDIDTRPKQILIEAKIMEVDNDFLRDLGVDWGTGSAGAEATSATSTPTFETATLNNDRNPFYEAGGRSQGSAVSPAVFSPLSTISGVEPFDAGMELVFKRLFGPQFEVVVHALEEDANTNTLSAPHILTLDNQEANILVGTRYPITKSEASAVSENLVTTTLDYYQDVGVQLNVVPQVGANNHINMVVHPAVTSYVINSSGYPVITTREAETRIMMKDGETVMIGGLLKDVKAKSTIGVPFLSKIPILGFLFRRDTYDTLKVDLLIFITARVVGEEDFSSDKIVSMEERFEDNITEE